MAMTNQAGGKCFAIPDVCKVPAPPAGPVPTPFPNMAMAETADPGTCSKQVKIEMMSALLLKTKWKSSQGDEAGVAGGVVSNKNMGEVGFTMGSLVVKIEGSPATFMGCPTIHNGTPPNAVGAALQAGQQKVQIMM
ncbi:MAG: DUF4150 domain-containing protein [Candidatus Latescibacteria bacterium]|nr:DUF4150 domain-containing protein [Candidatus Latescibacterota bacterium]